MIRDLIDIDEEVEKEIDNYKFYRLTDEEHLMFHNLKIFKKFTHIFMHKDFSFNEIITSMQICNKNMLVLLIDRKYQVNGVLYDIGNPDKFCGYDKYSISRFYNFRFCGGSIIWGAKTIRLKSELKLHSKISYFHELIFYIREVCKNEIPEDVIKHILGFI